MAIFADSMVSNDALWCAVTIGVKITQRKDSESGCGMPDEDISSNAFNADVAFECACAQTVTTTYINDQWIYLTMTNNIEHNFT